jgi:hypothetical protein
MAILNRRCAYARVSFASPEQHAGESPGMWRSLVAHLTGGQGVAGSNPVIPTGSNSRSEAVSERSEAVSFLSGGPKCSNACSNGTDSHQPIAAESRSTAERAPSVETWPYTSPVTATEECPSISETVCNGTPATSMCAANQCHSVCRPTPFIPKALAASDRPQCLLGLTAVPLPVVKTRPVSTKIEAALSRSTAWLALTHPRAPQSRGRGHVTG